MWVLIWFYVLMSSVVVVVVVLVVLQPQTSGLSQPSVVISPLAALPMGLCVMAPGCWCSVVWWNMGSTATTCTNYR